MVLEKISFIFCEFSHYKVFFFWYVADFFFNVSVTIRLSVTRVLDITWYTSCIVQKINFSIKDFPSKCDQIHRKLQIWSHLLKKSLMKNFIFCAVVISKLVRWKPKIHWKLPMIWYFPRGELSYVKLSRRQTLFTREQFYGPDFHRGTLRGGFSRGSKTGCMQYFFRFFLENVVHDQYIRYVNA